MVKLHEYQSKVILRRAGIRTPKGGAVTTAGEARAMAIGIGSSVVVKGQVFVTGRAGKHLIYFAETPDEAADAASNLRWTVRWSKNASISSVNSMSA
jgi:succinyl-CoA synthetase beta subunit